MKDSGIAWIGVIPKDWEVGQVKQCFYRKNEKSCIEKPIVLSLARSGVKVRDISTNEGQIAESYYNYNPVEPYDLLLNPMDLYSGANCSLSYVYGVISPAYINLRFIGQNNPRFFDYYFKTQYWSMAFFAHGKGISFDNRWTLNAETILNYKIPIPPIVRQNLIADFLDKKCTEIDETITLQERIIEELRAYKQSIITETVTKGLDRNVKMKDSEVDWIGEIPEHWKLTRLRSLGWVQNGISQSGDYFGEEYPYPFVSYPDAYKNYSVPYPNGRANSTEEDRVKYSLIEGDVLFTRTSETIDEIGFASTCMETIPDAVFSGFLIRFRPTSHNLFKGYSKYYFRSQMHRAYFVKEMNLVTRASLSQNLLKDMYVLLPSQEEQREIASYLDEKCSDIDTLISVRQQKIETLKEYKKSLIYEYVTGKKQVI